MPTIDDLPPDVQARIAAAMFLAAVDEPPRRDVVTVNFRDLCIGYTAILVIAVAWLFIARPTDWNVFVAVACLVPLIACAYAGAEFLWLLLVSHFGRLVSRLFRIPGSAG